MEISNEEVKNLKDGGVILAMAQNQGGKVIGLKVVADLPYDWESIEHNAVKMVDALKKYEEEYEDYKQRGSEEGEKHEY